ncbi:MAG: 30S ribosome-binding factor RbfA [bacterium]|nr:30S ribosome-binding factor RbfA [bacterium]
MSIKQDRVGGRIRQILSELLLREIADPRLAGLTITKVELDPELQFAKVWVNALGEEEREAEILLALQHAKGFLRREVGKRVRLRKTPDLQFKWDSSLDHGEKMHRLIEDLDIAPASPQPQSGSPPRIGADDEG